MKGSLILLALIFLFSLAGCGMGEQRPIDSDTGGIESSLSSGVQEAPSSIGGELASMEESQETREEMPQTEASPRQRITLTINGQEFSLLLYDNEAASAFSAMLPRTMAMTELHGNEKYFYVEGNLPTASQDVGQISSGDLMLYGDNCVVLFYESFSTTYRYTPLGRVEDPSGLAEAVG